MDLYSNECKQAKVHSTLSLRLVRKIKYSNAAPRLKHKQANKPNKDVDFDSVRHLHQKKKIELPIKGKKVMKSRELLG